MNPQFDSHFQQKLMVVTFKEPSQIHNKSDLLSLRSHWMKELQKWHSPYKAAMDCSQLEILQPENLKDEWERFVSFLNGFYLRKLVGYGYNALFGHEFLPFKVWTTEEEAFKDLGIRSPGQKREASDFRQTIIFDNHFRQHVVELTFSQPVELDEEKIQVLKAKLMNNLALWHSSWSLLIDCQNVAIPQENHALFQNMVKFFNGFFMKKVVGYNRRGHPADLPFLTKRARHQAAAELEAEGIFSGEEANCRSRKNGDTPL